jgi:hypothetical protein
MFGSVNTKKGMIYGSEGKRMKESKWKVYTQTEKTGTAGG